MNAEDKHGISPLLAAVWEGHTSCVKFLLEKVSFKLKPTSKRAPLLLQGAARDGKTPDGSSYVEAAEKPEIKAK